MKQKYIDECSRKFCIFIDSRCGSTFLVVGMQTESCHFFEKPYHVVISSNANLLPPRVYNLFSSAGQFDIVGKRRA